MRTLTVIVAVAAALFLVGCGTEPAPPVSAGIPSPLAEDLVPEETGKADGYLFDKNRLIDDHRFEDPAYLTLAAVQAFLEATPYGTPSFLADYRVGDVTAAEIIMRASQKYGISPLVLLVKLQVEASLVYAIDPSPQALERAMGCACPDDGACAAREAGFDTQVSCAAEYFRSYLDQLDGSGETWTGWKVNKSLISLDGLVVTPRNRATAALYTYTPWVLPLRGGNWLFWNVLTKFSRHLEMQQAPNYHWIGGYCDNDAGCPFDEGTCLTVATLFCTRPCVGLCPDSNAPSVAVTFCVDLGTQLTGEPAGYCVSRCDQALFGQTGCADGFDCVDSERFGGNPTTAKICRPRG